uniref:hypothetical protein n=1 Tax=Hemiaulus sinensis TaxID=1003062 RepID=UPI002027919C|nr:hypothetical protein NDB36_mgp19 [Hemiaulus sinensis]QYB23194.1 hypothetical protein [Hemiaulus sinensis]
MVYILVGKLMSLCVYYLLFNLLNSFNLLDNLYILERLLCWFLVEHVSDLYSQTAGKLFLVNKDFRELILNTLISFISVIILSYFSTLIEFSILIFLIGSLIYTMFYLINSKNVVIYYLNSIFLVIWCSVIISVLTFRIYSNFTWFDFAFMFQPLLICFAFSLNFYCLYLFIFNFVTLIKKVYCNINFNKFSYKVFKIVLIKLKIYCFVFMFIFLCSLVIGLKNDIFLNEYFFQDFLICLTIILSLYNLDLIIFNLNYFIKKTVIRFFKTSILYNCKLLTIKLKFYCLTFSIIFFNLYYLGLENTVLLHNNFFQELLIKSLYIYTFLYYF